MISLDIADFYRSIGIKNPTEYYKCTLEELFDHFRSMRETNMALLKQNNRTRAELYTMYKLQFEDQLKREYIKISDLEKMTMKEVANIIGEER